MTQSPIRYARRTLSASGASSPPGPRTSLYTHPLLHGQATCPTGLQARAAREAEGLSLAQQRQRAFSYRWRRRRLTPRMLKRRGGGRAPHLSLMLVRWLTILAWWRA